jgi:hypothetical protein
MIANDLRQQLVNEQKTGTLAEVQLPLERVTAVHGILFDLDPKLYQPDNTLFPPDTDPKAFFQKVKPVLDRHPLARLAEVRVSGTGLHVIVRLDPPAELKSAAAQRHWDAVVGAVQCTLPGDVNAPRITALTRAVGSTNSKNGATVEVLRPGEAVAPRVVEEFLTRVCKARFREVATILLGGERVQPCPVCRGAGSRLDALDHVGHCYGTCGEVTLAQVFDCVYQPFPQAGDGGRGTKKSKAKLGAAVQKGRASPPAAARAPKR